MIHLIKKYLVIFREAWIVRKSFDTPVRLRDEYDFLPAHLELIEKPVSPYPRIIARIIILSLIIAILIATFCKVEIVAVAPGKLILNGRSKIIQSLETSRVNKVHVKNGELVKKGQLLISLTGTGAEAENAKNESILAQLHLDEQRQKALLKAIEAGTPPSIISITGTNIKGTIRLMEEEYEAWRMSREKQKIVIRQKLAEQEIIQSQIDKLEKQKRIISVKLRDIRALYHKQAVSKHYLLDNENQHIEISSELDALRNQLKEAQETIIHANNEYKLLKQTYRRDLLEKLNETQETIQQITHEIDKNRERQEALLITSPVDGIVQELETFTEGGVVTTAQTLMVIVPENDQLDAQIMISNKDIGFITPGQKVVIKVEAFPYTRYGYLYGKVKFISSEVVEDKEKGMYFDGEITLTNSTLQVNGKKVILTSGMSITAEVITGYRRVIDFIISPLRKTIDESFIER